MFDPNSSQANLAKIFEIASKQDFVKYQNYRCYPGLIFYQGMRTMLQINVPARHLSNILQAKPSTSNDPESGKDRPTIKGHAEEIQQYLSERIANNTPWILGTITTNVAPELIDVIEFGSGFCIVAIPKDVKLDMADGQHRKNAIENLVRNSDLLNNDSLPITIVLESNTQQCRIDFRDMAQAKPVEKSLLLAFSELRDREGIVKILTENVLMFKGKVDKLQKKPSQNSKLIYTNHYLAIMVSFAFTDTSNDRLKGWDIEKYSQSLSLGLNQFFANCEQTNYISETPIEKLSLKEIDEFRKDCLLGVSIGIQLLGRLLYCTYDPHRNLFNSERIAKLSQLNWLRTNTLWHNNILRTDPKDQDSGKTYISFGASALDDAVKIAKIYLGWD